MNFTLTEEQALLRDSASRLFGGSRREGAGRLPCATWNGGDELWQQYADLGWLAICLPESAGGWGATAIDCMILLEEMGDALAIDPFITTACLSARTLALAQPTADCVSTMQAIGTGGELVTVSEVQGGDPRAAPCRLHVESSRIILSGQKLRVPYAGQAHKMIVDASLDGEAVLVLIERNGETVAVSDYPMMDDSRAGDVTFDRTVVEESAIIARGARVAQIIDEAVDHAIVAQCAYALGSLRTLLGMSSGHLATRRQFGQPLGAFQALQHRMADMFVEVDRLRSITYRAVASLGAAKEERNAAVSAAKFVMGQVGVDVGGAAVHLHGAMGMTEELSVGRHYRALLMSAQRFGVGRSHLDRYVHYLHSR
jgi:alkylation response protein AidB-like acyl-CoA dehydrogenase